MVNPMWLLSTTFRHPAVRVVIALGVLVMLPSCGQERENLEDATITLSASAISPNEIALSWTEAVFLLDGDYEVFMNGAFLLATETTSAVASGLMPKTRYCFQIQIDTTPIFSPPAREYSDVVCATTLPTP